METQQKIQSKLESKIDENIDIKALREWQEGQFPLGDAYDPDTLSKKLREVNRSTIEQYYNNINSNIIKNIAVKFAQLRGWDYSTIYKKINEETERILESENRKLKQMLLDYYALKDKIQYKRKEITKKGSELRNYEKNTHLTEEEIDDIDRILMYKKNSGEANIELKLLSPDFLNYSVSQLIDEKEKRCGIIENAKIKISQIQYDINKIGITIDELENAARVQEIAINKQEEFLIKAYSTKSVYASQEFAKVLKDMIDMGKRHKSVADTINKAGRILNGQSSISDLVREAIHMMTPNLTSPEVSESNEQLRKELKSEGEKQRKNSAILATVAESYLEKYSYSTSDF